MDKPLPEERTSEANTFPTRRERLMASGEVLLGAVAVFGHNVFKTTSNEVPILDVILIVSLLIRRRPLRSVGISRPRSWKLTAAVAVCGGILLQLKDVVTEPLAHLFWHRQEKVSSVLTSAHHSPLLLLKSLVIVWIFAAVGEEFAYRALLLRRTADALSSSHLAYAVAAVASSILFGFGHFYKGPTGVFDSTISGLILAAAYLITRRNIWASVVAHGISDTVAVVFSYFAL